jgi:hypothetical protein
MLPSSTGAEPPPGSLSLGRWFGIDVYLEAAILLPVALIVLPIMQQIPGSMGLILGLLLFVMLFGSVLLHEFGHALMARRCGVGTRRISLGMLGGVALLDGPSPTVKGDILITIAGPLVNVVLWFLADAALGFVRQAAASGAGFHESGMPLNESLFFTGMTLDLLRDINKGLLFFNPGLPHGRWPAPLRPAPPQAGTPQGHAHHPPRGHGRRRPHARLRRLALHQWRRRHHHGLHRLPDPLRLTPQNPLDPRRARSSLVQSALQIK